MTTISQISVTWCQIADYDATRHVHQCLYVFHHEILGERPFYIGKAKRLGGIARSRYNPGYGYLIDAMLLADFRLFIALLSPAQFGDAEHYEEYLIQQWNPCRNKRRGRVEAWPVDCKRPW